MSFVYSCKNCGGPATKAQCVAKKVSVGGSRYAVEGGTLGTWHCVNKCTRSKVKVTRSKS